MIRTDNTVIRATIPDDAGTLFRLYDPRVPRAALLDQRREMPLPTHSELEETLSRQDGARGGFYTVENHAGEIIGFCAFRGQNHEARFGEVAVLFLDVAMSDSPAAGEVFAFLKERAFIREHLQKVVAHCLDSELILKRSYLAHGFESAGVQRDAYFSGGRYAGIESLACFHGTAEVRHGH